MSFRWTPSHLRYLALFLELTATGITMLYVLFVHETLAEVKTVEGDTVAVIEDTTPHRIAIGVALGLQVLAFSLFVYAENWGARDIERRLRESEDALSRHPA